MVAQIDVDRGHLPDNLTVLVRDLVKFDKIHQLGCLLLLFDLNEVLCKLRLEIPVNY